MKKMKLVMQWIAAVFCFLAVLTYNFNVCSLFFLVAGVLFLPIPVMRNFLKDKMKIRGSIACILALMLLFVGAFTAPSIEMNTQVPTQSPADTSQTNRPAGNSSTGTSQTDDSTSNETPNITATAIPTMQEGTNENLSNSTISLSDIPVYSGDAFVSINDNKPFFTISELTTTAYESYSNLDSLGRCGVAVACCGQEIMPTGERGDISSVKPSGWVQAQYSFVSGSYLYNRCHLIGWQLSAENDNEKNLITGTRYFNTEAMLPFENMIADYIKETGNHVMYRVTPIYEGNNLVASGVQLEGYSVEDSGDGICFNVYCYNVQPGVEIKYATGESSLVGTSATATPVLTPTKEPTKAPTKEPTKEPTKVPTKEPTKEPTKAPVVTDDNDNDEVVSADYILNTSTKKIHHTSCRDINKMAEKNKQEYTGDIDDLLEDGYTTCGHCF